MKTTTKSVGAKVVVKAFKKDGPRKVVDRVARADGAALVRLDRPVRGFRLWTDSELKEVAP